MCGIAGGIGFIDPKINEVKLSLYHRGPDSSGSFYENDLFLVHTRLAIQDLSENGSQPMYSDDGRYVIVFNGEIYNHMEIRSKIGNNVIFRSTCDTETVLLAYLRFGENCLNMLNGIFALAIYDRLNKELFIARDQFGVKPLYFYTDNKNRFLFSSEIKTFLSFNLDLDLNINAISNYLTFLYSPGPSTPYENINKLLPGHYLKLNIEAKNQLKCINYYKSNFEELLSNIPENELINICENKILKAVERQMLSDVPIGFFLSGGLDSSLIVAMARRLFPSMEINCFTIDTSNWFMNEGFSDDLYFAKKVAEHLNVNLHIVKAEINITEDFDRMIFNLDEPQADASPLNVLNIAKLARQNDIKVLIGGTAGDDIFSGYRRHQALRYEKYIQSTPLIIRKIFQSLLEMIPLNKPFLRRAKKIFSDIDKSPLERQSGYFGWLPTEIVKSLFTDEWKLRLGAYNPYSYFYQLAKDLPEKSDDLTRMLYWELKSFLVDHNLNYTDKMAMAVGVEVRVPFLDLELFEFSKLIPSSLKMKDGEAKYILKKVAERYLPNDVIYRPKTGFGAPVRKWIKTDLQLMIEERLSHERLQKRGIFDSKKVWELIEANKAGKIDASYSIWSLLAIESWLAQFVDLDKY